MTFRLRVFFFFLLMDIQLFQHCCKKGDPFQGLKVGSCLTLGNEWFKETHVLTKQEILLGRGTWADSRNPGELSAGRPVFHGDGISFRVVFSQSFTTFLVVPIGTIHQPRWMLMPARRILGGGWTRSVTFRPFLNSPGWWWLISSMFLSRTSCPKTTHANGYYAAWLGWAVSVSVLPLNNTIC